MAVKTRSQVQLSGALLYGRATSPQLAPLGTLSFHAAQSQNLRFALPAKLRSQMPLGSSARLILAIAAKPDSATGCAKPGIVHRWLKVKVVRVFSARQAGVN